MIRLLALFFALILFSAPVMAADGKVLDVQKLTTPGGIEVWLVEDTSVPVISMNFSFDGGLAYDPEDKPGTGRLVSILLDEGAGDIKSREFQTELNNNAIHMRFSAGRDAFTGELKTLRDNRAKAFDLLRLALSQPRFDSDAIERMRNANIGQIKEDMGKPGWLAARIYNGTVFEGHPYARPGYGTLESMARITRKDLQAFVTAQFARNVLKVAIAGDISKQEALEAVDDIFSPLPATAAPVELKDVALGYVGKTILLPLNTPQTYVLAGEQGINPHDPDWHAALVMNNILGGGGFDARLMSEIREKRGLTYGIYSSLPTMKHAALIQTSFSAGNEKAPEAIKLLRAEWKKMAEQGATEQEVADSKAYLTGSLLLNLTSTDDISGALNGLQQDGFDADYINRRNAEINTVTAEDVKRAAARLLKPDDLTIVLVGQPAAFTADIMLDEPPGMGGKE